MCSQFVLLVWLHFSLGHQQHKMWPFQQKCNNNTSQLLPILDLESSIKQFFSLLSLCESSHYMLFVNRIENPDTVCSVFQSSNSCIHISSISITSFNKYLLIGKFKVFIFIIKWRLWIVSSQLCSDFSEEFTFALSQRGENRKLPTDLFYLNVYF